MLDEFKIHVSRLIHIYYMQNNILNFPNFYTINQSRVSIFRNANYHIKKTIKNYLSIITKYKLFLYYNIIYEKIFIREYK